MRWLHAVPAVVFEALSAEGLEGDTKGTTMTTTIYKQLASVKALDMKKQMIEFVPTHQKVDASSEVVLVDGLSLERYQQNPVFCLQHDPLRPVGRTISLVRRTLDNAPALIGRAILPEGDAEADLAYERVMKGLYNGVSIGFLSFAQGPPILPG
jgi:hypothetical protein